MYQMRVPEAFKYYSVQLCANLAVAATRLFLPNLAKSLGSTNTQIGVIGAVSNLTVYGPVLTGKQLREVKDEFGHFKRDFNGRKIDT